MENSEFEIRNSIIAIVGEGEAVANSNNFASEYSFTKGLAGGP